MADENGGLFSEIGKIGHKVSNLENEMKEKAKEEAHHLFHKIANGHLKTGESDSQADTAKTEAADKTAKTDVTAKTQTAGTTAKTTEIKLTPLAELNTNIQDQILKTSASGDKAPQIQLSKTLDLKSGPDLKANPDQLVMPPLTFETSNSILQKSQDPLDLAKYTKIAVPDGPGLSAKVADTTNTISIDTNLSKAQTEPVSAVNEMFIRTPDPTSAIGFRYEPNPLWKAPTAAGTDTSAQSTAGLVSNKTDVAAKADTTAVPATTDKLVIDPKKVVPADKSTTTGATVADKNIAQKPGESGLATGIRTPSTTQAKSEVQAPAKANSQTKVEATAPAKTAAAGKVTPHEATTEVKKVTPTQDKAKVEAPKAPPVDALKVFDTRNNALKLRPGFCEIGKSCSEVIENGKVKELLRPEGLRSFDYDSTGRMNKYALHHPDGTTDVYKRDGGDNWTKFKVIKDASGKEQEVKQDDKYALHGKIFVDDKGTMTFLNAIPNEKGEHHFTVYHPGTTKQDQTQPDTYVQNMLYDMVHKNAKSVSLAQSIWDPRDLGAYAMQQIRQEHLQSILKDGPDPLLKMRRGALSDEEQIAAAVLIKYMEKRKEPQFNLDTIDFDDKSPYTVYKSTESARQMVRSEIYKLTATDIVDALSKK